MHDSTLKPIVFIPSEQLENFKSVSKKLFDIIARITKLDKIPVRRGLDILSCSLGYSSHPDMVTRSKGYRIKKGDDPFEIIPQQKLFEIASNLSRQIDALSYEKAKKALFLLNSSKKKISTQSLLETISGLKCPSDKEYTDIINPLHQALILENFNRASSVIRNLNIPALSEPTKIELVVLCVIYGLNDDLKYLLKEGAPSDSALDSKGWAQPLVIAIVHKNIDAQILLVKNGADINRDKIIGYEWSLPFFAIEYGSHKLLNYCIDEGLLNHDDEYLSFCLQVNCLHTTASILRIASVENIIDSVKEAVYQGNAYQFAFLYKLYESDFDRIDFNECLPKYNIKPGMLIGILRTFLCYPSFMSRLDINRVAVRIIDFVAFSYKDFKQECDQLIQEFLISPESHFRKALDPELIVRNLLSTSDQSLCLKVIEFINYYGMNSSLKAVYDQIFSDKFPLPLLKIIGNLPQIDYLNSESSISTYNKEWRVRWVKIYVDKAESLKGDEPKEKSSECLDLARECIAVAKRLSERLGLTEEEISEIGISNIGGDEPKEKSSEFLDLASECIAVLVK